MLNCNQLEYVELADECELIAAHIHPSHQEHFNNGTAMMRVPSGMANALIYNLYCGIPVNTQVESQAEAGALKRT
jgi:hypothetical protein